MKKLTFLFLLISLISCQKEKRNFIPDTKISGVVTDVNTATGIKNISVSVYEEGSSSMFFSFPDVKRKSCQTNRKGEYNLSFDATEGESYFVCIDDAGFCKDTKYGVALFSNNQFQHDLYSKGELKVTLKHSLSDSVKNVRLLVKNTGEICNLSAPTDYAFMGDETESKQFYVRGNEIIHLRLSVKKNGIETVVNDSVFCKGGELTEKEIIY